MAVEDIVVQGKNEFEKLLLTILRTRINIIRVRSIFLGGFLMKVNKMAMILGVLLAGSLSMGQGRALAAEAPAL